MARYIVETDQGNFEVETEDEQPEKSLSGFASNAVEDVKGMGSGVVDLGKRMLENPIDTSVSVGKALPGVILDRAKELGGVELLQGDFGGAAGKFADAAYEKPVSTFLDVMPVVGAGAKGVQLGAKALEGANVADKAADLGNLMARKELGYTKGLINTEDKLGKAKNAADWAVDKSIVGKGLSPEQKQALVNDIKAKSWDTMGQTYSDPKLAGKALDVNAVKAKINELRPENGGQPLEGGYFDQFKGELDKVNQTIDAYGGDIPWDKAQELKNVMRSSTKFDATAPSQVNDLKKRVSGVFRNEMEAQLKHQLGDTDEALAAYNAAKTDYGNAKNVGKALENRVSSNEGNRLVGLTDFVAGSAGFGFGGPIGAAGAYIGKKAVERYGLDLGAAGLKKLSETISNAPQTFGKFAPALKAASAKGPQTLAATHFLLQQRDPEYQKLVNGDENAK